MKSVKKLLAAALILCLGMFSAPGAAAADVPETLTLPAPTEGWADSYTAFLEGCYDIFQALWPDGISGMGFIDLDLDGTPELVVFDQGASIAMGAHLFDLVDGEVYCVSSGLDSAAGAFTSDHLSGVSVCANFFESFRLSRTDTGWCFWVDSTNGTMETAWDEFVRFECDGGVLKPVSVCGRYLESDPATGAVETEQYSVSGVSADQQVYQTAADGYLNALDAGYEACGVFRWNDMQTYDTSTYEGFMALAQAAVAAYVPITDVVPLASLAP